MLSLLVSLIVKYKNENDHSHGDSRLCNISSLIESLLKKFAQLDANYMKELKKLAPHVVCNLQQQDSEYSLQDSMPLVLLQILQRKKMILRPWKVMLKAESI